MSRLCWSDSAGGAVPRGQAAAPSASVEMPWWQSVTKARAGLAMAAKARNRAQEIIVVRRLSVMSGKRVSTPALPPRPCQISATPQRLPMLLTTAVVSWLAVAAAVGPSVAPIEAPEPRPTEIYDVRLVVDVPIILVAATSGLVRIVYEDDLARIRCPC